MNEVQFRRVGSPRPTDWKTGAARGNNWFVYIMTDEDMLARPGLDHPDTWTRAKMRNWFNLYHYDWRLVSPEGKVFAEIRAEGWGRIP